MPKDASETIKVAFNPAFPKKALALLKGTVPSPLAIAHMSGAPDQVCNIFRAAYDSVPDNHELAVKTGWSRVHAAGWFKNKEDRWVRRRFQVVQAAKKTDLKNFQNKKETPPDPRDGHVHEAAFDEDGDGGTSEAGNPPHVHAVFEFKVQPYYEYDPATSSEYVSVHPGSLAFAAQDPNNELIEMEIFRAGTHNKMEFDEADLEEMAANFHALKDELRPKLKITHRDHQEKIAGLASYGDVVDVFTRKGQDGKKRLFAKVSNVPKEVRSWIKDRRFPERSIELYPEFQLGTQDNAPTYKNVLKAIALLGAEMPAVSGMAPIMLEECVECQGTVCINVFKQKESVIQQDAQVPESLALAFKMTEMELGQTTKGVM